MAVSEGIVLDPWPDVDERHKVRIYEKSLGGVTGLLPSEFSWRHSNSYDSPLSGLLSDFNTGVQLALNFFKIDQEKTFSGLVKELNTSIWTGGSPIHIGFQLLYIARKSARLDVHGPVRRIVQMAAPSTTLRAAAEKKLGEGTAVNVSATVMRAPPVVQVELGRTMVLKSAYIVSANYSMSNVVDEEGLPTAAKVELAIQTRRPFLSDDLEVDVVTTPTKYGINGE